MTKQNKIFLKSEGDNFFLRNKNVWFNDKDLIVEKVVKLDKKKKIKSVLEIGCGDGWRLDLIKKKINSKCYGVEPSMKAIKFSKNKNIKIIRGTAEKLGFKNLKFDVLIYGFCLYLVDVEDLFKVVYEADKILKKNSHIIIYDFYSKNSKYLNYRHDKRVKVHKYDFSKIFLWHPQYKLVEQKIFEMFKNQKTTKTKNNWVPVVISIIKKI